MIRQNAGENFGDNRTKFLEAGGEVCYNEGDSYLEGRNEYSNMKEVVGNESLETTERGADCPVGPDNDDDRYGPGR
jgi:hypothetical protein